MQFFVLANNHGPLNIFRFFLLYRLLLIIKKIWIFLDSMVLCLAHPVSVIRQSVHTSVSGVGPVSRWPRPCVTRDVCLRCWPCVRLASAVCDAWRLSQVLALCHVGLGHVWHVTSVSGVGPVSHWPRPCVTRDVCLRCWPCVTLALSVCNTWRLSQVLALCHVGLGRVWRVTSVSGVGPVSRWPRPCVTCDVCLRCWPCVTLAPARQAVCDMWRLSQVLALCHLCLGYQLFMHYVHRVILFIILLFCIAFIPLMVEFWREGYKLVIVSFMVGGSTASRRWDAVIR